MNDIINVINKDINKDKHMYKLEFKIDKSSVKLLNPEFSLCDVLVCYGGENRNNSNISEQIIEKNLDSIYGIPIIAYYLKPITNEDDFGGHSSRIIIDDQGVKYEDLTKPIGFVTKEARNSAAWVWITESDGTTKRRYLKLKDCILWSGRYSECELILENNFGQSMEISGIDGEYRDDGIFDISSFNFSALCVLGTKYEPCFQSAAIGTNFSFEAIKQEVVSMIESYNKFSTDIKDNNKPNKIKQNSEAGENKLGKEKFSEENKKRLRDAAKKKVCSESEDEDEKKKKRCGENTDGVGREEDVENSSKKEDSESKKTKGSGDSKMAVKQSIVDSILSQMSDRTFKTNDGHTYKKYEVLLVTETEVSFVDREDAYKVYSAPYISKDETTTINMASKVEKSLVAGDKVESSFSIQREVDQISYNKVEDAKRANESKEYADLLIKYNAEVEANKKFSKDISEYKEQNAILVQEKVDYMAQAHKDAVTTVVSTYSIVLDKSPEFMSYCAYLDYSKDIAVIENELKILYANYNLSKQKYGVKPSIINHSHGIVTNNSGGCSDLPYGGLLEEYK